MGKHSIFQVSMNQSRMLIVNQELNRFSAQARASPDVIRAYSAITNFKGKACYIIGGKKLDQEKFETSLTGSVSCYNIIWDTWEPGIYIP